ncbi:hypothetical protein DL770_000235 [Monosporascus sp. CRB-9-2]|nr:hypothetical protein DL770_000235 [Monosporascus sp. CRB-9-2]
MAGKRVDAHVQQDSSPSGRSTVDQPDSGDGLLESLGYRQEFRREFTRWSTLSYAISILGVLGSVPASWGAPLASGGPATAVWTWVSGSFFSLCIALSVAELVSAYPTSGGMYITKHVFPPDKVPIAAWVIGPPGSQALHTQLLKWLVRMSRSDQLAYMRQILAAVSIGSAREDGTFAYAPTAEITVAVCIAVLICLGILCSFPSKRLSEMIRWFAPINLLGSLAISIALLVLTPNKLPASEVFGHVIDGSGWNSKGFSFLIGYLSVAWIMTDYDATAHMSEELHNAAISAPVAIVQAIVVSWFFGWLLNIALGFGAADLDGVLSSPLGNPAAQVFMNAGGRAGGLAMWFWVILVQFFTGISAMLSDTRTCFALARDEALPFHSVWTVVIFCCLLNLIALGSTQTINGIFGITAPAMDLSYVAVIAARMYYEKEYPIQKGPFMLGRWQKPINVTAIVWVIFISVILFFPPTYPVTALNMNYAVAIAAFIALFALTWWYLEAKK